MAPVTDEPLDVSEFVRDWELQVRTLRAREQELTDEADRLRDLVAELRAERDECKAEAERLLAEMGGVGSPPNVH